MVMNQINFRNAEFTNSTMKDDMENGIDGWVDVIPFATRRRNIPVTKWADISIRYSLPSGEDTEFHKIIDGRFKAIFYLFIFDDATIIVRTRDIYTLLKAGKYKIKNNKDDSQGAYISLMDISYLLEGLGEK
jgi:hypothetical protein